MVLCILLFLSCKDDRNETANSKTDISDISTKEFTEFKVEDSKFINVDELWEPFEEELKSFSENEYETIKPLIFEQTIPVIQENIASGKLTYEALTKFYLFRIRKFDRNNNKSLNSVIALNSNVIQQARQADNQRLNSVSHPIYGMPILLKDNINTSELPTTAGAVALLSNETDDAFIVKRLKEKGAIILGKTNLSEWAYFFCGDCPSGYSAVGGQTFNPYGRKTMDTGGSSSGSAVAVAANFCAAAIGSETSGSILSPASQNSTVGLKPTIGLVSRSGIIPISSTLDTAGPITKSVIDNGIVLDAIMEFDKSDKKSIKPVEPNGELFKKIHASKFMYGKRFAAFNRLKEDSLYVHAIDLLKSQGADVIEIDEEDIDLPQFLRLLNLDMKIDLPAYFKNYGNKELSVTSVKDVIDFNAKDSLKNAPYGQKLFKGIVEDSASKVDYTNIKTTLKSNGMAYFDRAFETYQLDGFLSINNYHAGFAAVAEYPAITVPMGYAKDGVPRGLTFIAKPLQEMQLLEWAYAFEKASKSRISPKNYN